MPASFPRRGTGKPPTHKVHLLYVTRGLCTHVVVGVVLCCCHYHLFLLSTVIGVALFRCSDSLRVKCQQIVPLHKIIPCSLDVIFRPRFIGARKGDENCGTRATSSRGAEHQGRKASQVNTRKTYKMSDKAVQLSKHANEMYLPRATQE